MSRRSRYNTYSYHTNSPVPIIVLFTRMKEKTSENATLQTSRLKHFQIFFNVTTNFPSFFRQNVSSILVCSRQLFFTSKRTRKCHKVFPTSCSSQPQLCLCLYLTWSRVYYHRRIGQGKGFSFCFVKSI